MSALLVYAINDVGRVFGPIPTCDEQRYDWTALDLLIVGELRLGEPDIPGQNGFVPLQTALAPAMDVQRRLKARSATCVANSDGVWQKAAERRAARAPVRAEPRSITPVAHTPAEAEETTRAARLAHAADAPAMQHVIRLVSEGTYVKDALRQAQVPRTRLKQWLMRSGLFEPYGWFEAAYAEAQEQGARARGQTPHSEAGFGVEIGLGASGPTLLRPLSRPGWVYFLAPETGDRVKIGFTELRVEVRRRQIQTMSPVPLTVVGFFWADQEAEAELHTLFDDERSHGEWFHASDRLLRFIARANPIGRFENPTYAVFAALVGE